MQRQKFYPSTELSESRYKLDEHESILDAEGCRGRSIGQFPSYLAKKIIKLALKNNYLKTLDGVEQFSNLCEIDVRYNRIAEGQELLKLYKMRNLTRVYIGGNPFLEQPLSEQVLEFILEKQTDIEILSSEALSKIKQLEEGELKVVFLENYLKKINCHEEMMSRSGKSYDSNNSSSKQIISRLMPQLYTTIDDEKIKAKIKRQAINFKKNHNLTFEEAMTIRKRDQQAQVKKLIDNLSSMVDEGEEAFPQNQESTKKQIKGQYETSKQTIRKQMNLNPLSSNFYSFNNPENNLPQSPKLLPFPQMNYLEPFSSTYNPNISHNTSFSFDQYESLYNNSLAKSNPIFTLLYSDINTLGNEEKNILIQALQKDHKAKSIELLRERDLRKDYRNEIEEKFKNFYEEKKQFESKVRQQEENNALKSKYLTLSQRQNVRLNNLLSTLSVDVQKTKKQNIELKQETKNKLAQISRISFNYDQIYEQKNKMLESEMKEEQIMEIRERRIKKKYFQIVLKRAQQYYIIRNNAKKRKEKQEQNLLIGSWARLKKYVYIHLNFKMNVQDRENKVKRKYFDILVKNREINKQMSCKEKKLIIFLKKNNFQKVILHQRDKKNEQNQIKLKNFWADSHFLKVVVYKFIKKVKEEQHQIIKKDQKARVYYFKFLKKKAFSYLLQNKKNIAEKIKAIQQNNQSFLINIFKNMYRNCLKMKLNKQKDGILNNIQIILANAKRKKDIKQFFHLFRRDYQSLLRKKKKLRKKIQTKKLLTFSLIIKNLRSLHINSYALKKNILRKKILHLYSRFKKQQQRKKKLRNFINKAKKTLIINHMRIESKQLYMERLCDEKKIRQFFAKFLRYAYASKLQKQIYQKNRVIQEAKEVIQDLQISQTRKVQQMIQERQKQQLLREEQFIKLRLAFQEELKIQQNDNEDNIKHIKVLTQQIQGLNQKEAGWVKQKIRLYEQITQQDLKCKEKDLQFDELKVQLERIKNKYGELSKKYNECLELLEKKDKDRHYLIETLKEKQIELKTPKKPTPDFVSLRNRMF